MCFVQTPKENAPAQDDTAQASADAEYTRRRKAQGYGASLLTSPSTLGPAPLGRSTLGGQ